MTCNVHRFAAGFFHSACISKIFNVSTLRASFFPQLRSIPLFGWLGHTHPQGRASGSPPVSGCQAWRCTASSCAFVTLSVCSSPWDKFHKVELLGQRASGHIILMDVAQLLPTGCVPSYSPTSTVWEDAKESSSTCVLLGHRGAGAFVHLLLVSSQRLANHASSSVLFLYNISWQYSTAIIIDASFFKTKSSRI